MLVDAVPGALQTVALLSAVKNAVWFVVVVLEVTEAEFADVPPLLLLLKQNSTNKLDVPFHVNGVVRVCVTVNGAVPLRI